MSLPLPAPSVPAPDAVFAYTNQVMLPEVIKFLLYLAGILLVFTVWKRFRAQ